MRSNDESVAIDQIGGRPAIAEAYAHCERIAREHYENFTVGSWLLPRRLRRHIAAIYAFARTADDIADEGTLTAVDRLDHLRAWEEALLACYRGSAHHPIFIALGHTVSEFDLPIDPFLHLLRAFEADIAFHGFEDFEDLSRYCHNSANPVGHLILYLFGYRDSQRQALADQICTGLQLTNFWQDVAVDAGRGRLYIPREDLRRFGCNDEDVKRGVCTDEFRRLMAFEVARARHVLTSGLPLAGGVDRRLGREVGLFAAGGLAILTAIERQGYDVLQSRPVVSAATKIRLVLRALLRPPLMTNLARPEPLARDVGKGVRA